tara:strand:+ start:6050 stop:7183 length:1134 start_codon:yes stop_codon:yes gene_type:complete
MGFFEGLNNLAGSKGYSAPDQVVQPIEKIGLGHVLSVVTSIDDRDFDPTENINIGTIYFRDVFAKGGEHSFDETKKQLFAAPIDRSSYKLPIPGEQVIIYRARASKLDGPDETSFLFYGSIVNMSPNITSNPAPFVGATPLNIASSLFGGTSLSSTFNELGSRFDKKTKNLIAFKDTSGKPIVHKQLLPNEGDFILQGRFGGSIRFTGTPMDDQIKDQIWAEGKVGTVGDPITILRVSGTTADRKKVGTESYEVEDINADPTSIYLTTTQQVGLDLAIPEKGEKIHPLASWAYTYGIDPLDSEYGGAGGAQDGEESRNGTDQKASKDVNKEDSFEPSNASGVDELPSPPPATNDPNDPLNAIVEITPENFENPPTDN